MNLSTVVKNVLLLKRVAERPPKDLVDGSPMGHELIALEISVLCGWHSVLCSWLVFSGFAKSTKKAQRRHIEGA